MSNKINYYKVVFYFKNEPSIKETGFVKLSKTKKNNEFPLFSYVHYIDKPEHMALLMDKNNAYDFVVLSGEPFYQETNKNEQIEPKIENKGIVYDSVHVGMYLSKNFRIDVMLSTLLNEDEVNNILVNAGIYFIQWHSNRKNTDKAKEINRTVLYLRTLRYLKEKHNINLI